MFRGTTYVVLDVPSPHKERIQAIRVTREKDFHAGLPVDITLAGSGGLGSIVKDQNPKEVYAKLNKLAVSIEPITACFDKVIKFPKTNTVALSLKDDRPFKSLQRKLAASGVKFKPSKYPFIPHCTLSSTTPLTEDELKMLQNLKFEEEFNLGTLSVYQLPTPVKLLHRVKLGDIR